MENENRKHYQKHQWSINSLSVIDQIMQRIQSLIFVFSELDFIEKQLSISHMPVSKESHHDRSILQ